MGMQRSDLIRRRVSLVVMGIDDFTNQIVRDTSLQIWIPGQARPVRKEAGYYVFLNCPQQQVSVKLDAPFFHDVELTVNLQQEQDNPPILRIRLHPNEYYPFPKGVFLLEGKAPPNSVIQVLGGDSPVVKLMGDYRKKDCGKLLKLFQSDALCLDGKLFEISSKSGSSKEQFRIDQQQEGEMFCYCLERPLQKDYKKTQTIIRPVAETQTDDRGQYLLPIYCREGKSLSCQCFSEKKSQQRECQVSGNRMQLDFDREKKGGK